MVGEKAMLVSCGFWQFSEEHLSKLTIIYIKLPFWMKLAALGGTFTKQILRGENDLSAHI